MMNARFGTVLGLTAVAVLGAAAAPGCSDDAAAPTITLPDGGKVTFDGGGSVDASVTIDAIAGLPGASLDVGSVDCGTTATKTVELTNSGGKPLEVSLAAAAPFTISPATLSVPAGGKGSVTVSVTVPVTSTAGTAITADVTITTNDPQKPKVTVPVSVTPAGATLEFEGTPTAADFGTSKLGVKDTDITVKVKNVGNKDAAVSFGAPADTQFSVAAPAATLAAGSTVDVVASFTPNKLTPSATASNITVTGAVCGTSVAKIDMNGQGTVGNVTGWPGAALDFGATACGGAAAAAQSFTLTNAGTDEVTITTVAIGNKGYSVNVANGAKVPANNGTLQVTVTPPAIPFPSPVPGNYGDTLTLTTDIPNDAPHSIGLALAASGAILQFDTTATPSFGSFGNIPVNTTATQGLSITNTGNAAATVTPSAGAGFFGVSASSLNVPAGGSQALSTTFTPTNNQPQAGQLSITATGLCQPLPNALPLSGTGTSGGIAITESSLSFQANCGATAAPKGFTVTNTGNATMSFTASLGGGANSPYTISPTEKTLGAGGPTTITVTPKPIPANPPSIDPAAYADTITIITDIPGDAPHVISLSETPIGAILNWGHAAPAFGPIPVNTSSSPQPLSIVNSGNPGSSASVGILSSDARFVVNGLPGTSSPGSAYATTLTFSPGAAPVASTSSLSMDVAQGTPLCAPIPAPIVASGTGTLAQVAFSPPNLDFALTNCGSTATPQAITFTNPGNQDYTLSAVLEHGTAYSISINPPSGVVPANNGGAVTITVTPNPIPSSVPVLPSLDVFSDKLTVTTTAADDVPHEIALTQGAKGVILRPITSQSWNFGSVIFGSTGFYNQSIRNDGNVDVTVSMPNLTVAQFGFNPVNVPSNSGATIVGSFTPSATTGFWTDTAAITVPVGTVLCQPLPDLAVTMAGSGADGTTISLAGALNFPAQECGAAAGAPAAITITNNGNASAPWSAVMQNGSDFVIVGPTNGSVPAFGGTATVNVQPKTLAASGSMFSGSHTDNLVLTVNANVYNVPASVVALGADLVGSLTDSAASDVNEALNLAFFNLHGYFSDIATYTFFNHGNQSATVTPTTFTRAGWSAPPTLLAANGNPIVHELRWSGRRPTHACLQTLPATASMTMSGAVCHKPWAGALGANITSYIVRCF